jgi:hypothetical protein
MTAFGYFPGDVTMATSISTMHTSTQRQRSADSFTTSKSDGRLAVPDDRWPAIVDAITGLRDRGRCSIRIVDCDCGAGDTLLCAARYARSLGFTAVEARGVDGAASLVARACSRAARVLDSAIGVTFELRDPVTALRDEADFPADIVLWRSARTKRQEVLEAVSAAADIAIGDTGTVSRYRGRMDRTA